MPSALRKRSREFAKEFAAARDYLVWVLNAGFYPNSLLPESFTASSAKFKKGTISFGKYLWKNYLKISPPDDSATSNTFGVYHPDALHNLLLIINKEADLKTLLGQSKRITSYSLPMPIGNGDSGMRGAADFLKFEEDVLKDMWEYQRLVKLDVKQCYPSIYSHSIEWAIHGRGKSREEDPITLNVKTIDNSGPGKSIDKYVRAMHGGITKGIAVGPAASDLVVEILMRQVDKEISEMLAKRQIDAYGGRYKDDYKILIADSKREAEVVEIVRAALSRYLLQLNNEKTVQGHPFEVHQRDWMVEYHSVLSNNPKSLKQFLWHLSFVGGLQLRYPKKRLLAKYLKELRYEPKNISEVEQVISALLSLADVHPPVVPMTVSYLERVAEKIAKNEIGLRILKKLEIEPNPYNAVWYVHYLSTYPDIKYDRKFRSNILARFPRDRFLKSIVYQKDKMFPDNNIGGTYFVVIKNKKIYEQTALFSEDYG